MWGKEVEGEGKGFEEVPLGDMFSADQVYRVLDACSIQYRRVAEGSSEQPCHCPYHEDRRPSFRINLIRGVWVCFSCGRRGNLWTLTRDILGVSLPRVLGDDVFLSETSALFSRLSLNTQSWFYRRGGEPLSEVLVQGEVVDALDAPECRAYLDRRGFDPEVVRALGLRYTDQARVNGLEYRKRLLVYAGIGQTTCLVEGRDITGMAIPKVLYPPRSYRGFVYRADQVDPSEPVYVVEGTTDVMRVFPRTQNVVSTFGATLTPSQVAQLDSLPTPALVVVPDRDEAGTRMVEVLSRELSRDLWVSPVPPPFKDIGDVPSRAVSGVLSNIIEASTYLRRGGHRWGGFFVA